MKSRNVLILMFLSAFLLSACSFGGGRGVIFDDSGNKADARIEQIQTAIATKDSEALKSLFSEKALRESDNLDNNIKELFDLIQGEITFSERDGLSGSESIDNGKRSRMVQFAFNLATSIDTYSFFVIDYIEDTIDPDNEGVYMLELIEYTSKEDLESWQKRMQAGIYIH